LTLIYTIVARWQSAHCSILNFAKFFLTQVKISN
jgi:hypothetical protein